MNVWRDKEVVHVQRTNEITRDSFASIIFIAHEQERFVYRDAVLYISNDTANISRQMILNMKKYVEDPQRYIPHCTRVSLLHWILTALLPSFEKEYEKNEREYRKCKRKKKPLFWWWCCCWGWFFILILTGSIIGTVVVSRQQSTPTSGPTTSPGAFSIECGTENYY